MRLRRLFMSRTRRRCLANLDLALSSLPDGPCRQRPRPEPSPHGSSGPNARRVLVIPDVADVASTS